MAIVQISKIIHRVGAEIDLPQLDTGELGFASDTNKVFIGNDPIVHPPGNPSETTQTELLTDSSTLSFAQLGGAASTTLNLANVHTGQLLVANADAWTNAGGSAGGLITLGTAGNIKISGGVNGYVLQTDGAGNLTWATNGAVKNDIANIAYLSSHVLDSQGAVVVTTKLPHLFATGSTVTVMGTSDAAFSSDLALSGVTLPNAITGVYHATNRFYVQRLTETTFSLYTDSNAVTNPVNGTGWNPSYVANTGYALGFVPASGNNTPGGANTQVQFNNSGGSFGGSSHFTFNTVTNVLTVGGNIAATNITSNVAGSFNGMVGATTPNTGSFTTLVASGTASITGNLTAGNITSNVAGSFNGTVGAITPNSGAFTTVNASGTVAITGNLTAGNITTANSIKAHNVNLSFDNGANSFTMFANATGIFATNNITNTTYAVALTPV